MFLESVCGGSRCWHFRLNLCHPKDKQKLRKKLGLDLPLFYFSVSDMASCDTIHKVQDRDQRENLEKLLHEYGNWRSVNNYYKSLLNLQKQQQSIDIEFICKQDSRLDKNNVNVLTIHWYKPNNIEKNSNH